MDRDEIVFGQMLSMIRESADAKRSRPLTLDDINPALVNFIGSYDSYVVFWNEGDVERRLVIHWSNKDDGTHFRGNAAFVQDHLAALALRIACRSDDNIAPEVEHTEATPEMLAEWDDSKVIKGEI
ncbi:hypothetical protein ACVIHI_005784 [Bradyrhizobium sp. USDA 4524]|uniref:hypothetical protein n=1 Tax=unclassified Bradyrhizobium TaxID=2631580 RepID=UPI00209F1344|nr:MULTISPECIES: hypothetical protein [unclassified Bradyrhizobium]MCP1841295.1 hypothetical protein [Bradyrhizobium sp. USDA 4538]MCP1901858.1 hypothetical protein [Bradyrhizobium sp. USDA 4537]MCP1992485.1 hypothetical protein [Bradyrhizobium sp. USDA 4539]